jgi:hypothetical protein
MNVETVTPARAFLAMTATAAGTALTYAENVLMALRIGGAAVTLAIGIFTIIQMRRRS